MNEPIDTKVINKLAEILDKNNLSELEYEANGCRIYLTKNNQTNILNTPTVYPPEQTITQPTPTVLPKQETSILPERNVSLDNNPDVLRSPLVGVVYMAPDAKSNPYVKLGDNVTEGTTMCLVEAMKTFNPVKAHKSGKVVEIIATNASPVEYGEPLFIID